MIIGKTAVFQRKNCRLLPETVKFANGIHICEHDNMGVRYQLMHIYAYFEDEQAALALHKQYDGYNETEMLLPLSVLYYKKGDYTKALSYLRRLNDANKDVRNFFGSLAGYEDFDDSLPEPELEYGFRPNTIEELMLEVEANSFLFMNMDAYLDWAYRQILKM